MTTPRFPGTPLAFLLVLAACGTDTTAPTTDRIIEVAAGDNATCGIADDGRVLCWGTDHTGSLGDGTATSHDEPLPVASRERFTQVTLGSAHTCGLTRSGRAYCWGSNLESQLGVATTDLECLIPAEVPTGFYYDRGNDCSTRPVPVETSLRFLQIDAGEAQTCGVSTDHEIWCWGSAFFGSSSGRWTSAAPIHVGAPTKFQSLALSWDHACAIDTDGLGWCWGSAWYGALGMGSTGASLVPARIASDAPLSSIAVGSYHSCAVTKAGGALCWGQGYSGQLGDSTETGEQFTPVVVKGGLSFSTIAASYSTTCALERGSGAAWCWGENSGAELGDGTLLDRTVPSRVLGGLSFSKLSMASRGYWSPAVPPQSYGTHGGQVYAWGPLPRPLTFEE